jgi:hypothetical protein
LTLVKRDGGLLVFVSLNKNLVGLNENASRFASAPLDDDLDKAGEGFQDYIVRLQKQVGCDENPTNAFHRIVSRLS